MSEKQKSYRLTFIGFLTVIFLFAAVILAVVGIVYHQPTAVEVERRGIEEMRDLIGHLCFAFVLVMGGIVIIMGGIRFMMWLFDRWFDRKLD